MNYLFPFHAPEYLNHHAIKLTLLYKRSSIPDFDRPASIPDGGSVGAISLFLAYQRSIYAFIYYQPRLGQVEDEALLASFLRVSEDGETGDAMLDLNAWLFRKTRNHALDWLDRTYAGTRAPLSLTVKSAVDVDYLKIWRLGDLGLSKKRGSGKDFGSARETVIFDVGAVRRIAGLSILLNNLYDRAYRISIVRTYSSNDGITWMTREIGAENKRSTIDRQVFEFNTTFTSRYFKFEIDSGRIFQQSDISP